MPVLFDTLEKETSSIQGYLHQTLLSDVPQELRKERPCVSIEGATQII